MYLNINIHHLIIGSIQFDYATVLVILDIPIYLIFKTSQSFKT